MHTECTTVGRHGTREGGHPAEVIGIAQLPDDYRSIASHRA